nr:MFS transporter [uncultured Desulfuromonas sp.]
MGEKNLRFATLFVVCVAHFLMPFMMSAVGVALPVIGRDFGASAMQLGLVETSYVASASIFLLAMGRLGDILGRRKIFQVGLGLFTLAGGLISQAWAVHVVIALRFFQGMGGAMVMATTMAIVVAVFPDKERGKALGIAVASVYAGISCGPFIGGTLVSVLGWRSIFYLCIPLGLTALLITTLLLREEWIGAAGEPFDWQGWLIYALSIAAVVVGATHLAEGVLYQVLLGGGLCGLIVFLWFETRRRFPLLNMDLLLHNRVFALSNLAAMFNYAGTFSITFFFSLFLQVVLGFAPHQAGGILIIQPLVQTLFSPVCGRLSDRYPAEKVATAGMALCAVGIGLAATLTATSPLSFIVGILVVLGLGFALFSSPNTRVIMTSVAERDLGVASGFSACMRTLGMMTSMTIVTVIFSWRMAGQPITPQTQSLFISSMHLALMIFSGLCAVAVFSSFGRHQSGRRPGKCL